MFVNFSTMNIKQLQKERNVLTVKLCSQRHMHGGLYSVYRSVQYCWSNRIQVPNSWDLH